MFPLSIIQKWGIVLLSIGAILLVLFFRVQIASILWHQSRSFPEVLLVFSQDAALGVDMAGHYFDQVDGSVSYDIDRAKRLYTMALKIDPDAPKVHYQLARIAFLQSHYEASLDHIATIISLMGIDDVDVNVFYLKGLVQAFAGQLEESLETFKYYYTFDHTSWYIHNNLAWVYFQLGDYEAVDRISGEGLKYNPQNPWLLMDRALAQFNLGNRAYAQALLTEAEEFARQQTEADWLTTYPGNDPAIAQWGLQEFFNTLLYNQQLFENDS